AVRDRSGQPRAPRRARRGRAGLGPGGGAMVRLALIALAFAACSFESHKFDDRHCNGDADCTRPDEACMANLCTQVPCAIANDCNGLTDSQESACRPACSNGIDDDGDGLVDMDDPGCASPDDDNERGTTVCDNGFDDDNDGRMDFHADGTGDPGCSSPFGNS